MNRGMHREVPRFFLLLAFLLLAGCAGKMPETTPLARSEREQVEAGYAEFAKRVCPLSLDADIALEMQLLGKTEKSAGMLQYEGPSSLRYAIVDPLGRSHFIIATDGYAFTMVYNREAKAVTGSTASRFWALKGRRDKVYVATKTLPTSRSKEDIYKDVETSLRALGTDYIDVIQLHNLTDRERVFIPEARQALQRLKEQGKVRFFGVTTHKNQVEVLGALVEDRDRFFDTVLVAYNFKSGRAETEAIARAARAHIGVIAMKTQAGGYATDALGSVSPHQAALKWVLGNSDVTAAIPSMRDMGELREDTAVMGMPFGHARKPAPPGEVSSISSSPRGP